MCRLSLILLCLLSAYFGEAQNGFNITKDFCADANEAGAVMSVLADSSNFFVFGLTKTSNVSNMHSYLASFDYKGSPLWIKNMYAPGKINGITGYNSIIRAGDDKYLLFGAVKDYDIAPPSVVLYPYYYLFNSNGDSLDLKVFKEPQLRSNIIISALYDGSGIVTACSYAFSVSPGDYTLRLTKLDKNRNKIWEKDYLRYAHSPAKDLNITLSADSAHYVIAGGIYDSVKQEWGSCMVKVDTAGNLKWVKSLPKKHISHYYFDIIANPTGGYYFTSSYSTLPFWGGGPQGSTLYFGKLDEQGDTLWTRTLSDSLNQAMGYQIRWSNGKQHLLINATGNIWKLPALVKIDTLGNVNWYRRIQYYYDYPNGQQLNCLAITPDEHYLMAGHILTTNGNLGWMILTDSNGCRYPNDPACWPLSVATATNAASITVHPNPANDVVYIDLPEPIQQATIYLHDMTGRLLRQKPVKPGRNAMDISALPAGMYIIKITGPEGVLKTEKLIKK